MITPGTMRNCHLSTNSKIWESIYSDGHRLSYPNDVCVRVLSRILPKTPVRVLDYGFGSGELLIHLAKLGHSVSGIEVSTSAIATATDRLKQEGLSTQLVHAPKPATLPFTDREFDLIVSWQVLNYQSRNELNQTLREFARILKPGGKLLVALMARGDYQEAISKPLGESVFEIQTGTQTGAQIILFDDSLIQEFFGNDVEIGHFSHSFDGSDFLNKIVLKKF